MFTHYNSNFFTFQTKQINELITAQVDKIFTIKSYSAQTKAHLQKCTQASKIAIRSIQDREDPPSDKIYKNPKTQQFARPLLCNRASFEHKTCLPGPIQRLHVPTVATVNPVPRKDIRVR